MTKLYELSAAFKSIQALIESAEDNNDWSQALESLNDDITTKAENIARMVRSLEAEADMYAAEYNRLKAKGEAAVNAAHRLKDYLKSQLEGMGLDRVKGQLFTVALQASPPSCTVTDEDAVEEQYKTFIPARYEVNKRALIEAWKHGWETAGTIISQGKHLRIR